MPHRQREPLAARFPAHVTVKLVEGLPSLRRGAEYRVLRRAFRAGSDRRGFRLVQFTVLSNHMHWIVEGKNREALSHGVQGLLVRLGSARCNRTRRGTIRRTAAIRLRAGAPGIEHGQLVEPRLVESGLCLGTPPEAAAGRDSWRPDLSRRPREPPPRGCGSGPRGERCPNPIGSKEPWREHADAPRDREPQGHDIQVANSPSLIQRSPCFSRTHRPPLPQRKPQRLET